MENNLIIRPMTKNDIDGVYEVEENCFVDTWSKDAFNKELKNDFTIVESYRNSNIMETGGITLEILYCIYVSMEHIGIADNLSGHLVSSLQKIVIICINAGYHAISHITTQ